MGEPDLWLARGLRAWEREGRLSLAPAGEGCWWVRPSMFPLLWVAANELPLREALIPFLTARTGKKLEEFVAWVVPRRPPAWLAELMYAQPEVSEMIESMEDKVSPETLERMMLALRRSKIVKKIAAESRDEGFGPIEHQFARRLSRPVTESERAELLRRLDTLGPDRIGDVVLDLAPDALALWLADPDAR